MPSEILAERDGRVGRLRLNRPEAIHALTRDMCVAMIEALLGWQKDPAIEAVILDHAAGRGFCAGGDVVRLRASGARGGTHARTFFFDEYRLNHLLFTYEKPVIAFMDGIVMGGGVGISQPARFRIATERTRFAMPETAIGLFPDVGGGRYLSRLPGRSGQFLALTGARLDGAECATLGLATHYIGSEKLEAVKARIAQSPGAIETILAEAAEPLPEARISGNRARIDSAFSSDQFEEILEALSRDGSDWAQKELDTLQTKSPQACKVTLRLLSQSAGIEDFAEEMALEYRLASRVVLRHDFLEGVRALLIDKDGAPRWDPSSPAGVTEAMLDAIFAPLPKSEEWTPL